MKRYYKFLRYMSWIRQNLAEKKDVRGIILTESVDQSLTEIIKETPNAITKYA